MRVKDAQCDWCDRAIYAYNQEEYTYYSALCIDCANDLQIMPGEDETTFYRNYRVYCLDRSRRPEPIE